MSVKLGSINNKDYYIRASVTNFRFSASSSLGFLHLPSEFNSGVCDTSQPVRFEENQSSVMLII